MRAVVSAVAATDPDREAYYQQLAQRTGMGVDLVRHDPKAAQQRALNVDLDQRDLEIRNPILADQLRDPNFAGVAHDDLDSLTRIDEGAMRLRAISQNPEALNGLTPTQREAVIDERTRVAMERYRNGGGNGFWSGAYAEAKSAAASFNTGVTGFFKPIIDDVGTGIEDALDTPKALMDGLTGIDPSFQGLKNVWVRPHGSATRDVTQQAQDYLSAPILSGPQKTLIDPVTKQPFANPDYSGWGRGLGNAVEQVPGQLLALYLGGGALGAAGEAAGVDGAAAAAEAGSGEASAPSMAGEAFAHKTLPMVLGTQAAQTTYAQARQKGADQKTAAMAALYAGVANYAFMGKMPEPVPAESFGGLAGQYFARSAAFGTGMAVSDNAIARGSYDPDRGLLEDVPQSILQMAAFEGLGAGGQLADLGGEAIARWRGRNAAPQAPAEPTPFAQTMADQVAAVEQSKLRARSPQDFQQSVNQQFEGDASLRIPAQEFVNYFDAQKLDPAMMANRVGVRNLEEAAAAGSDLEIPSAKFFGQLDPEHQRGLLSDVVDPMTEMTARQAEQHRAELQEFLANGGVSKLMEDARQADAETQATPGWQAVKDEMRQRYVEAGVSEREAEDKATLDANVHANLAREAGLTPEELFHSTNPKVKVGDAPSSSEIPTHQQPWYQSAIDGIRSVVAAAKQKGDVKKWTKYAPVSDWLRGAAKNVGLTLDGFEHGLDADAVRHANAAHSDAKSEKNRGLVAITDEDFEKIPLVVSEPDRVVFGAKSGDGLDQLFYIKKMNDGSIVHVEEVRTGRKRLAAVSLRKHPAAANIDKVITNLDHNVRNDGGRTPLIVVDGPGADKSEGAAEPGKTLYQSRSPIGGADGKQSTLLTPGGKLPAKYRLVEAADLIPSHNPQTFAVNGDYPQGVQERAYDKSKEAQARVIDQAQNYEPAYTINTNPDAVNGPPVITPDGTVLGGNSRTMSTVRLYRDGKGDVYRNALREQAGDYGLKPEEVDAMKEPVLVRQVQAPQSVDAMRRLGTDLNRSMTGALGATEKAVSVGKNLKPETLRWVSDELNAGDMTLREMLAARGGEVLKRFVQDGALTERERPQYIDSATGGLNESGKAFVEKALLGSVFDDPRLMESAPKSIVAKIERSLGAITSFASRGDAWNIVSALREAIDEHGSIQRSGSTVEDRIGQTSLFGEERNPLVDALVRVLASKPNAVKEAFDAYARDSDENLPGQNRMFGEASAFDAFNHAFGSKLSEQEFEDGRRSADESHGGPLPVSSGSDAHLPVASAGDTGSGGEELPRSGGGSREAVAKPESGGLVPGAQPEPAAAAEPLESIPDHPYASQETQAVSAEHGTRTLIPGTLGWMRRLPDGSFEIGKTKIGNFSTLVHETAHMYLETIRDLVKRPGASDRLKGDYQKILDFLGAKDGEDLTTEQHEKWARANEQYVREGKAPSPGLKGVFQRFAYWLHGVDGRAKDLGVELDPETRGVLDRMYQSERTVDQAAEETGPSMFKSPEEAGWTEAEFQKYAETKGIGVDQAKEQVRAELNAAAEREQTESRREEQRNVYDAAMEKIDKRPEYTAIRSLRKGKLDTGEEISLNRDQLVEQFGEDRVKALQKAHPGLYRLEGGADAESVAEIFGYHSADEMLQSLTAAPRRKAAIEQATRDYLVNKYGDVRYDGTLNDRARYAIENKERGANIYRELRALKAKVAALEKNASDAKAAMAGIEIAPMDAYRAAAKQMIDQKAIADLQPSRYLDASRRYSRDAFDALRSGNVKRAAEAKHKELLNHFLFPEATEARDYVDKFEKYVKQAVTSKGIQQRMALAGGDYRTQFNWLLARYGLAPAAEPPGRSLRAWADEMYDMGKEPANAPNILDSTKGRNYRNVPLSEIRDLHDTLLNIQALARQEFKTFVQGKQIVFAEAKQAMIDSARQNLREKPEKVFEENRPALDKKLDGLRYADSFLIRMERMIEWLDGGKSGPWHDNVWNLASDAQGDEYTMQHQVTHAVTDALANMPAEMRRRLWTEKVNVEGVGEPLTRRSLLSMAFNMGNEGNLDRLRKTFVSHGWDPDAIQRIGGMLTREEWQFVQKTWDSLKPLGERMNALEKRLTGLPPAMVQPTPMTIHLDGGETLHLDGGYYPIKMDPKYSDKGIAQDAKETAQNAMQSGYVRATTSKGYTKERTGFGGPLLLDYEQVLTDHVAKVAKDLSHREFMLSTQRLLLDTEVRKALRETLGPAYEAQLMPWLRTIINDRNGSAVQGLGKLSSAMQALRGNIVAASIGFKVSTSLLQITHAPRMLLYAKPGSIAQALVDFLARPREMTREIQELSPNEMRFRGDNLDRDVRAVLREPSYKEGFARKAAQAARFSLATVDHLFSHTLWSAAYRDGLAKYADLPEDEAQSKAVHEADSAVRLGLGTQAPKDLPAIMRNNDFNKMITTLYGFHNGVYNQLRDNAHQFRYGEGSAAGRVGKLTYATILTAIVPSLLGSLVTGDGPKDGENPGLWAAKKALLFSADTVPVLGSFAHAAVERRDMQLTPLENVFTKAGKVAMDATSGKEDKDWLGIGLNAAEAAGDVAGVPGSGQLVKTLRYAHRANQGKIENPSWWDAIAGGGSTAHK